MRINEETAQLILDAIAWSNKFWFEQSGIILSPFDQLKLDRSDFVQFCKDRGIDEIIKKIQ